MKELSIEQKAKAYDEAIKKAKDMLSYKEVRQEDMEYLFPELKESEDERIKKNCIHFLELQKRHHAATFEIEECIAWLEKQGKQKYAWSEEDELNLNQAIYVCHQNDYNGVEKWLKSLKDRVQPKQEWSEEDGKIIIELIDIFESAVDGTHVTFPYRLLKDYIRILKACRPQKQWKPSDEQIEALESATENCAYSEYQDCLRELIEQFKKYMKE